MTRHSVRCLDGLHGHALDIVRLRIVLVLVPIRRRKCRDCGGHRGDESLDLPAYCNEQILDERQCGGDHSLSIPSDVDLQSNGRCGI
jgi:hypothetical protein